MNLIKKNCKILSELCFTFLIILKRRENQNSSFMLQKKYEKQPQRENFIKDCATLFAFIHSISKNNVHKHHFCKVGKKPPISFFFHIKKQPEMKCKREKKTLFFTSLLITKYLLINDDFG